MVIGLVFSLWLWPLAVEEVIAMNKITTITKIHITLNNQGLAPSVAKDLVSSITILFLTVFG